jgi:hypothetical protein
MNVCRDPRLLSGRYLSTSRFFEGLKGFRQIAMRCCVERAKTCAELRHGLKRATKSCAMKESQRRHKPIFGASRQATLSAATCREQSRDNSVTFSTNVTGKAEHEGS